MAPNTHLYKRKDQHLYIEFIDLQAAFETLDLRTLWNTP